MALQANITRRELQEPWKRRPVRIMAACAFTINNWRMRLIRILGSIMTSGTDSYQRIGEK